MTKKIWSGIWPVGCDFCKDNLENHKWFVDGKTTMGPWALMCSRCFPKYGAGLGLGRGQKYTTVPRRPENQDELIDAMAKVRTVLSALDPSQMSKPTRTCIESCIAELSKQIEINK